ncbi:hypothetical protein BKA69DRAFT_724604 [Paraphysoderma sedebokerense]|nr:hypothetical protein BKA69DRAFT_724604 [Paraphysoderma sedebokerense]
MVTTETWVSWILENSGQCLSNVDFLTFKWLVRLVCFKMIVYLNGKYYLKPSEMVSIAVEVSWKIVSPTCSRFQFPALFPRISDHMLQRHLLQISRILTVKDGLSVIFEKIGQENCEKKDLNELLFSRLKLHNMNAVNLIFHVPHPLPTPPLEKADFDLIPKHVGKQPIFT